MFFAAWLPGTLFETAWTIAPTSFLGSTFGIANNDKKKRGGRGLVGEDEHNTYFVMTISKKLIGRAVFMLIFV